MVSGRNEEEVIGCWMRGDPCYKLKKNLAELCSCSDALWKIEIVRNEIGYLAEEIFKQSVEQVTWFFLTACSEMW